jgi:hypothetical protein
MTTTTAETLITIGVDIGKLRDPAAICVSEAFPGDRHVVHRLERYPLDLPYTELARRLGDVYRRTVSRLVKQQTQADYKAGGFMRNVTGEEYKQEARALARVYVLADSTGCGLPVVDDLRERSGIASGHLCGAQFTAGYGCDVHRGATSGTVSKSYLVSRLRAVIGSDHLELPDSDEARALLAELGDFEQNLSDQGTPTFNARPGAHDDLLCATALAVLLNEAAFECGSVRY